MALAALADPAVIDRHPKALVIGVAVSLLLHLGVAGILTLGPWAEPERPPPELVVDVVQLPKAPEPPPEPPRPAPPAASQPQLPPPPPPQLTEAPIAEKSAPPPHPAESHAPPREKAASPNHKKSLAAVPGAALPETAKEGEPTPVRRGPHDATPDDAGGKATQVASQSVQDFILMQVARAWIIDLHSPRFHGLEISWSFVLRPDGTLEAPFGKSDPWDLRRMVNPQTYAAMQEPTEQGQLFKTAVTTFLQAIRQAQPFRVPPNEQSYQNRVLPLRFRAADLSQTPTQATR
jgi:periplasmic protein TonB